MDERGHVLLMVLAGGLGSALLGAIFGGLTGLAHWRSGKATGGWFGLSVAAAFERAGRKPLPPGRKGFLVGAVDGLVFLGTFGACVVLAIVLWQPGYQQHLGTGLLALALLMLGAVAFGLTAYALVRIGSRAIGTSLLLSLGVGILGMRWVGTNGLLVGCLSGLALGATATLIFLPPPTRDE